MEKKITWILALFLFFGAFPLFADGTLKKESVLKQIGAIEKRGFVNFVTSPGEIVNAYKVEKKDHPKAWAATYLLRLIMNTAVRWSSAANDAFVVPWFVKTDDTRPLTRRFDLPDYVWEKE